LRLFVVKIVFSTNPRCFVTLYCPLIFCNNYWVLLPIVSYFLRSSHVCCYRNSFVLMRGILCTIQTLWMIA
jgi:hypothetical protein